MSGTLGIMVSGLKGLLGYISGERRDREDKLDDALTAIYTVAGETKIYINDMLKNGKRIRKRENKLSLGWAKAAALVRRFNIDLAERFLLKSDYWIKPENWTRDDIERNRIGIEEVCEEARALLSRK
jgi:hypothetical protein